ncbi:MAG: PAS domain S-box protein, partial [Methanotrichaceae archaeon]
AKPIHENDNARQKMSAYHNEKQIISFRSALILAVCITLCSLSVSTFLKSGELLTSINDATFVFVDLLAAFGLLYAAQKSAIYEGHVRLAWTVLFLGGLAHAMGDIIWTILEVGLHQTPFPSLADGWFLAQYPIFAIGILLLPKTPLASREKLKILLDMGIVIIAAVIVFWVLFIAPTIESNQGADTYTLAVSVAYPVMDLLLLFVLIELLFRKITSIPLGPILLLMVGTAVMIGTDLLFYGQTLQFGQSSVNSYFSGGLLDTGWIVAYLLVGLSGVLYADSLKFDPSSQAIVPKNIQFTWPLYLPYLLAGVSYMLLVWSYNHPLPISPSVLSLGVGGIIGLIIVRQILSLKENTNLYAAAQIEINERRLAEGELQKARESLEVRVQERTSELRSAHDALQESKEYLNKIINSIGDPIFVKDKQHRLVLVNEAECRLAGLTADEILGRTDYDFFPEKQVNTFWEQDDLVLETGKESVNEEQITDAKGYVRTIITKTTLFTDKWGEKFIVGVVRDITDRERAEEALVRKDFCLEQLPLPQISF